MDQRTCLWNYNEYYNDEFDLITTDESPGSKLHNDCATSKNIRYL